MEKKAPNGQARCALGFALLNAAAGSAAFAQSGADDALEQVVVTSSRIEMPSRQLGTAVSVLGRDEIELRGSTTIADLLRTQPGIAVSGSGGAGKVTALRIRGEDAYRTLVIVDGIELTDPTTPQAGPSVDHLLATSDLERIEVLRGTQGFIYGADAGGVVNIMSARGEGPVGGSIGVEYGAFDARTLEGRVEGGGERADFSVTVEDFETDGFNAQTADTVLRDADGYDNTTLHAKLGFQATERLRLQLVAHDIDARSAFDGCGFPISFDCVGTSRQTTYRASADLNSGKFDHVFALSNLDVSSASYADGVEAFATDGSLGRAEYTGSFAPTATTTLVYGLDLQREAIKSGPEDSRRRQDAYYFEYQNQLTDALFFSAGARYDDNEDFGSHTSSRVTLAYLQDLGAGSSIKYRASIGSGFRAPSLYEIAYNAGAFAFAPASDRPLSEETSAGYDLGVELVTSRGLHVGLTYFDQRISDEIYFDLASFSGYLQSAGHSESHGIEAAVDIPLAPRWDVLTNVTYNDTSTVDALQRVRRPRLFGNVALRYESTSERLRLIASYRFARDAVDELFGIGRVALDDYGVVDVSAAYTIGPRLALHARLENLADTQYEETAGFRTPGRTFSAGVTLEF